LPTVLELARAGTSRTLQRLRGEAGRASPISYTSVRFEYDENLFGVGGRDSPEETFTLFELSPLLEYHLSTKSTLQAQGTYDRITLANQNTSRRDYILDLSLDVETSIKTH